MVGPKLSIIDCPGLEPTPHPLLLFPPSYRAPRIIGTTVRRFERDEIVEGFGGCCGREALHTDGVEGTVAIFAVDEFRAFVFRGHCLDFESVLCLSTKRPYRRPVASGRVGVFRYFYDLQGWRPRMPGAVGEGHVSRKAIGANEDNIGSWGRLDGA
jgi:hypothetical protein